LVIFITVTRHKNDKSFAANAATPNLTVSSNQRTFWALSFDFREGERNWAIFGRIAGPLSCGGVLWDGLPAKTPTLAKGLAPKGYRARKGEAPTVASRGFNSCESVVLSLLLVHQTQPGKKERGF
jgi:hypothetical protein